MKGENKVMFLFRRQPISINCLPGIYALGMSTCSVAIGIRYIRFSSVFKNMNNTVTSLRVVPRIQHQTSLFYGLVRRRRKISFRKTRRQNGRTTTRNGELAPIVGMKMELKNARILRFVTLFRNDW
jgi:hypothetical protein